VRRGGEEVWASDLRRLEVGVGEGARERKSERAREEWRESGRKREISLSISFF